MTRFKDLTTRGKLGAIGTVCGSIMAVITLCGILWTSYKNYTEEVKKEELKELKEFIIKTNKEHESEILTKAISDMKETRETLDSLQLIIDDLREGSEYFAIGFRGDGSGQLWYRDMYGTIYKTYYDSEYEIYYYINEDGMAVYP